MLKIFSNINRSGKCSGASSSPGLIDPVPRADEEFAGVVAFLDNRGIVVPEDEIISGSHDAPVYAAFCTEAGSTTIMEQPVAVYRVERVGLVRAISHEFTMTSGQKGITVQHSIVMTPGCLGAFSNRYYLDMWFTWSAKRFVVAGPDQFALFRPAYDEMKGLGPSTHAWSANFPAGADKPSDVGSITFSENFSSGVQNNAISAMRSGFGTVTCGAFRRLDPHLQLGISGGNAVEALTTFAYPCAIQPDGTTLWWHAWLVGASDVDCCLVKQGDDSSANTEVQNVAPLALGSSVQA